MGLISRVSSRTYSFRDKLYCKMATGGGALEPYLMVLRKSLEASLNLSHFDSMLVERHNKPEIEMGTSREVVMNPLTITRSEMQRILIEPSINSVRISIKIKQANEIECLLTKHFTRFMTRRAENFEILRRKPMKDYDISFLITNFHLEDMIKDALIDFIVEFVRDVDKEISEMRITLNARAKLCAVNFLQAF